MAEIPEPSPQFDPTSTDAGHPLEDPAPGAPKRKWPLLVVIGVAAALLAVAAIILTQSQGATSPTVAEAKGCLEDAGYDTSRSTGVISLFAAGKPLSMPDEFWAERGTDQFAVWFFESEDDAGAAREALNSLVQKDQANTGDPVTAGSIAYAPGLSASVASIGEVEGCLGF